MTLQERQQREVRLLKMEMEEMTDPGEYEEALESLRLCESDPETYFKNIDNEE